MEADRPGVVMSDQAGPLAPPATRWSLAVVTIAAAGVTLGLLWDISWHTAIGRDTFWSPPHLAVYLGGLLEGSLGLWLVARTTADGRHATMTTACTCSSRRYVPSAARSA